MEKVAKMIIVISGVWWRCEYTKYHHGWKLMALPFIIYVTERYLLEKIVLKNHMQLILINIECVNFLFFQN